MAHGVEILQPSSCLTHNESGSVRFKIQAWPVGLEKEEFVKQLAASLIYLEISVKSSPGLDVWDFDVFPVPNVSHEKYLVCLGEASMHPFRVSDSTEGVSAQLFDPRLECKQAGTKKKYRFQRCLRKKTLLWEFGLPLGKGMHVVTAQLRNTTSGLQLGSDITYITVGLIPTQMELTEFAKDLSGKHTVLGNEEMELNRIRRSIAHQHEKLHPDLRDPSSLGNYIDSSLWSALESNDPLRIAALGHKEAPGVYSMSVFTSEFCRMLMEEVAHANQQSNNYSRPNTMNNYGVVLEELGFRPWLEEFISRVLNPVSAVYFGDWGGGFLDSHHAFTLRYQVGKDETLDRHMDLSEVTLNVCLGGHFEGADLYFHGRRAHVDEDQELGLLTHSPGVAILHVGQQFHGVHRLTKGERHNMVIWGRSSQFRSSAAETVMRECSPTSWTFIKDTLRLVAVNDEL